MFNLEFWAIKNPTVTFLQVVHYLPTLLDQLTPQSLHLYAYTEAITTHQVKLRVE